MTEDASPDVVAKAIRRLAIAVGCLCVALLIQVAFYIFGYMRSMRWVREATASSSMSSTWSESRVQLPAEPREEKPFHELPPEEMVARASVILLTSTEQGKDRTRAVVAEILKQDPDVTLYYSVGDEFPTLSFYPNEKKGVDCGVGEGEVVFMVGSPASMRTAYGITNGRIGGLADMPLTKLREMVKGKKKK
jgi:hypothetical protein